jgi:signal peptidase I
MEASFGLRTERRAAGTAARALLRAAQWAAALLAAAAFVGLAVLPHLGMYRTLTVLTASMKPTFSPGDVVVVRPEPIQQLKVGQVISYRVPVGVHQVETHRVVKILSGAGTTTPVIQTKGDNNTVVDPWTAQLNGTTVYRLVAVVPKAGYGINFMRGHMFHLISVFFIPMLLAGFALRRIWNAS